MEGYRFSQRQLARETVEATQTLVRLNQEEEYKKLHGDQSGQQKFLGANDALAAGRGVTSTTQRQVVVGGDEIGESSEGGNIVEAKVPRPPNAFMLYANERRRKLAAEFPDESNKAISVRLGNTWKSLDTVRKDYYFHLAKTIDAEHKLRYPDYVYCPKEARARKAMRDKSREEARINKGRSPSAKTLAAETITHPADASVEAGMQQVRVLDSKLRSPMMYTPWPETQGQYMTDDGYMEGHYESHETGNMVQNSWYPQYMEQDMSNVPYAQPWAHDPGYMHQRMYAGQDGPSQSYRMTYELPTGKRPAQPGDAQPAKRARTDVRQEATASSSRAPPATYNVVRRPTNQPRQSVKPTLSSTNQDPGSSSSTFTPTKGYHRYLSGCDGSPTAVWPRMYPDHTMRDHSYYQAPEAPEAKSGYNENVHQFTYYDDLPDEYMMQQDVMWKPEHNYNPFMYPPPMMEVHHPYPVSMHQILPLNLSRNKTPEQTPVTLRPIEEVDNNADSADDFTVVVDVVNEAELEAKGGHVIATYESQPKDEMQDNNVQILSASQNKKKKVHFANETYTFMQADSFKNILKSIDDDDVDKPRVIEENSNICVL